jgi:CBS domain-containing protein
MIISSEIQHNVASMDENCTVREAASQMAERYIGSLIVTGANGVIGIFSERDLMLAVGKNLDPASLKLTDVVTGPLVKVKPDDDCSFCLDLMKKNRCRHLAVFEGEDFVGIVSIRDMVALMLSEKEALINRLKEFITG